MLTKRREIAKTLFAECRLVKRIKVKTRSNDACDSAHHRPAPMRQFWYASLGFENHNIPAELAAINNPNAAMT
jgi:hypothetical protein